MHRKNKKTDFVSHCWNTKGVWSTADDKCELLDKHIHCRNCPVFSAEGKRVLDRAAPVGYLKEWRKSLSIKNSEETTSNKSVLVFRVGKEWFALPSACLHEVAEKRSIHRIPRNNNTDIGGVVNIGGEVRICYSLASILGVKDLAEEDRKFDSHSAARFIVTILNGEYYVFNVEQVSGLTWYGDNAIHPVPATVEYAGDNMISGIISHNKNKISVLDVDKLQSNLEGIVL
jgi:chemotaxis-related protein WspD